MAITESKKQSDLEKRLKFLRQQVYGKTDAPTHQHSDTLTTDITYLYQDLSKIGILASLAIGIQVILFFLMKNHLLNLKLF